MAIWTTKDGRTIKICDMTDSHLLNAHRMRVRMLKVMMETGDDGRLFFRARDPFEARAWNSVKWIEVFAKECCERGIKTLIDAPADASLICEPHFAFNGYDAKLVSEMEDAEVLDWYYVMSRASSIAFEYETAAWPTSDAASDAFEREYHLALGLDRKATDWLPLFGGEVGRRGLVVSDVQGK